MKDMNKQIVNCIENCLRFYCPNVFNYRHINRFKVINAKSVRYLCQSSNQRIISFNNLQTNSDQNEKISDKTKAKYLKHLI